MRIKCLFNIYKMSNTENVTLFIVGRTGNGKSSTGNSILSREYFFPESDTSDDMKIFRYSAPVLGKNITVIDGTGIGDIGEDLACSAETLLENTREALKDGGFDVLVFVLKYGVRFTKQEKDAVQRVKDMFGEDVFKTRGVIVMTYGDNFQLDNEDDNIEFVDWCRSQTGDVKKLFEEVQYKVILVNNRSKDQIRFQKEFFETIAPTLDKKMWFRKIKEVAMTLEGAYSWLTSNNIRKDDLLLLEIKVIDSHVKTIATQLGEVGFFEKIMSWIDRFCSRLRNAVHYVCHCVWRKRYNNLDSVP